MMPTNLLDLSQIKVSGAFESRLEIGLEHLLAQKASILAMTDWGGDQYGRWIPAVAMTYYQSEKQDFHLDECFGEFLKTQAPSGMFGAPLNAQIWWGAGRALIGLYEYWQIAQDEKALKAAKALADFYLSDYPFNEAGTNHQQGIEGLVAVWRATGERKYLDFAERLFATLDPEIGVPLGDAHGHHTHGYLCCLRGAVDLYEETGKNEYLALARRAWDHVIHHNMWVTGGISEGATYEFEHRDEGCSVADWVRFAYRLWQVTHEAHFMDVAEHILLNHLSFDQDIKGGFYTYRTLLDERVGPGEAVAWWCCSMHGQRALLDTLKFLVTYDDAGIDVNLYIDSDAHVSLASGTSVTVSQEVAYPFRAQVKVSPETQATFAVRLRIPYWTQGVQAKVNGVNVRAKVDNGRLVIDRLWKAGDVVELAFSPGIRIAPEGSNGFGAAMPSTFKQGANIHRAAVFYGPYVLMVDREVDAHLPEARRFELVVPVKDGHPFLDRAEDDEHPRGTHTISGVCFHTHGTAVSVDEGKRVAHGQLHRIHLIPVAETTDRTGHTPECFKVRNDVRFVGEAEYNELEST